MTARTSALLFSLALSPALSVVPLFAAGAKPCKETCEAERKKALEDLSRCLKQVDPIPREEAVNKRRQCHARYRIPRCEGLSPCPREDKSKRALPGLELEALVFSKEKNGPPLARPAFPAGSEMALRLPVLLTPRPEARKIWFQLDLRLLSLLDKARPVELARWDNTLQERRFIDPMERGLTLRFTLYSAPTVPADFRAGPYLAEMTVREKISGFSGTISAPFRVVPATGGGRPKQEVKGGR